MRKRSYIRIVSPRSGTDDGDARPRGPVRSLERRSIC
jgi:hypothetical protein